MTTSPQAKTFSTSFASTDVKLYPVQSSLYLYGPQLSQWSYI